MAPFSNIFATCSPSSFCWATLKEGPLLTCWLRGGSCAKSSFTPSTSDRISGSEVTTFQFPKHLLTLPPTGSLLHGSGPQGSTNTSSQGDSSSVLLITMFIGHIGPYWPSTAIADWCIDIPGLPWCPGSSPTSSATAAGRGSWLMRGGGGGWGRAPPVACEALESAPPGGLAWPTSDGGTPSKGPLGRREALALLLLGPHHLFILACFVPCAFLYSPFRNKQYLNRKDGTAITDPKDIAIEHAAVFTDNSSSAHYSATFQAIKE